MRLDNRQTLSSHLLSKTMPVYISTECPLPDKYCVITDTPLSQEETDALKVVLSGNGVKPGEVSLVESQSTLESVQQVLVKKGCKDLATNLSVKLSQGMPSDVVFQCK